jgi:hypothetical protein
MSLIKIVFYATSFGKRKYIGAIQTQMCTFIQTRTGADGFEY